MLESLSIRNMVLIEKLDLEFSEGLTILSGETGAGKSVLLDSLGLVSGQRADVSLIRNGADRLSVTATFSKPDDNSRIALLAAENEIELDDAIVIKRSLSLDGRSKIFINDQPVSLKLLKEFGAELLEIHGQSDNQGLLNSAVHRSILDRYGKCGEQLGVVAAAWKKYTDVREQRISTENNLEKSRQDADNLRHWVDELQKLKPIAGEENELLQRRSEMMNSEKIIESLNVAYASLIQNTDVLSAVRRAQTAIDRINMITNDKYHDIAEGLEQVLFNADEVVRQIEEVSSSLNYNQNEAESIEQRLFALRAAARKHGIDVNDLPQKLIEMQQELSALESGEEGLADLKNIEEKAWSKYLGESGKLTSLRRKAAEELDKSVMRELPPLKMEKARFVTQITELPESSYGVKGKDEVCFTVSTNPDSPQGPLNKIASGGELARLMLALKVNLVDAGGDVTMIFDEVDAGIGGATAQAVGSRLRDLGEKAQVLLVTHSPQVAACGHHHFKVEKKTENNITITYVNKLSACEREEEIARMLAGEVITDEARAAAKVLIKS